MDPALAPSDEVPAAPAGGDPAPVLPPPAPAPARSPAAAAASMGLRRPSGVSIEQPLPTIGETATAAFGRENDVFSLYRRMWDEQYPPEIGYSPEAFIRDNGLENWADSFLGARSQREAEAIRRRIDQETAENKILEASGTAGTVMSMTAGVLSPTLLLPGGALYRGGRAGQAALRSAATVGAWGAVGVAAQEGVLQSTQETREWEESAINISSGALLAGMIGASASALLSRTERKMLEATLERERNFLGAHRDGDPGAPAMLDTPTHLERPDAQAAPETAPVAPGEAPDVIPLARTGEERAATPGDAGAAVADTRQLQRVEALGSTVAQGLQRIIDADIPYVSAITKNIYGFSDRLGPLQRGLASEADPTRRIVSEMAEYPGLMKENVPKQIFDAEGKPVLNEQGLPTYEYKTTTLQGGPALDREFRIVFDGTKVAMGDEFDRLFQQYRFQDTQQVDQASWFSPSARTRAAWQDWRGQRPDGTLTYKEWSGQVSVAMSNGDQHAIPSVAQAAQWLRKNVFNPWLDRAIKKGMLDESVRDKTLGAESYFHRIYNKEALRRKPTQFIDMTARWLKKDQETKRAIQQEAQFLNAQRKSWETQINKFEAMASRLEATAAKLEARMDEAGRAIARGERRQEALGERKIAAAEEISELEEFIATMKEEIKDPELLDRIQQLEEQARVLKRAERQSEMTPAKLAKQEEEELKGILVGSEKTMAQIVTGQRKPIEPPSFLSWLIKQGGVKDPGGDVRSIIGGASARPGLVSNKGKALDQIGIAIKQEYPGAFPDQDIPGGGAPSPAEIQEWISEAARGREPDWWVDQLPEAQRRNLDASRAAVAMQEALSRVGIDPKNTKEVAKLLRDGQSGNVTLADLDRVAADMEQSGEIIPISIRTEVAGDAVAVAREGVTSMRTAIGKAQRAIENRVGRMRDAGTRSAEVDVAETATRGRMGVLSDRLTRSDVRRELIQESMVVAQRHLDDVRAKLEDAVGRWEGGSAQEGKAAIKAREKYIKENKTDLAGQPLPGGRLSMADDAVDRSINRMIEANKDLDDQEIRSLAEEIYNHVLGSPDGRINYDMESGGPKVGVGSRNTEARGPLMGRKLAIPDNELREGGFLIDDAEEVATTYLRTMAADVLTAERFGDVDMSKQIRDVQDYWDGKIREATEAGKSEKKIRDLTVNKDRDIRAIADMRDRIRGTYGFSSDNVMQQAGRIAATVGRWNVLTSLGSAAVSSLPDAAGALWRYGMDSVFRDAYRPYIQSLMSSDPAAAGKEARRQLRAMAIGVEVAQGMRANAMGDISDVYRPQSRIERTLEWGANKFMVANGLAHWTDAMKTVTGIVSMDAIVNASRALVEGKATPRQLQDLAEGNITPDLARAIHNQFFEKGFGEVRDGVYLPNVMDWTDNAARTAFIGAVRRVNDIAVIVPGQEKAMILSHPVTAILGQFKSFIGSSTERVLIANLQRRDAFTLQGLAGSIALGMLSYKLNSIAGGQKTSDRPQDWIKEGISRSGILGWYEEMNAMAGKASGGKLDVFRVIGADKPLSRYASRSGIDAFLGPTAGKVNNILKVSGAAFRTDKEGNSDWGGGDTRALKQLIATQNLVWTRALFNQIERGANDMLGIPNLPQR